ncbi:endonuclease/exonuclease/phosphatase family protein [Ideonella azotifigens]|uniref:Bulb-type lectin domain-containing protein n=1 Tax=Ideonella azotifigens TaxID=513160 RepID=A0ABN1KAS2_9BURK|nr:endonuclease/exonuclease/phosphatase family protein [Ideonella azotifigens]MCD2338817.1 endonuclease/exonuclease/phosphatase family protein [Ideonella azotifigens]
MTYFLLTGQKLRAGEHLTSPDGSCFLTQQRDGNLCLYQGPGPEARGGCIWAALGASLPQGDYFAAMQGDGNLCVYRQKPDGNTDFIWSTGTVAPGGKFMAVVEDAGLLTVRVGEADEHAKQPVLWASRRLRLLSFNTHLMEGSAIVTGAKLTGKLPVTFRDDERHAFIVEKVKQSGADVVALQEVWSANRMDNIRDDLKSVYPHSIRGTSGALNRAGSGIVLVSKFPLEDWQFNQFPETSEEDSEDAWATKGVLSATMKLDGGVKLRIGMTHAWTNAGNKDARCTNIENLIGWTLGGRGDMPAALLGDFNVHRIGDPAKFATLESLMAAQGATDSWTRVHGPDQALASATDDHIHNTLDQFFTPGSDTPDSDCLDYVYLKDGAQTPLRPLQATVLRDWHYPLNTSNPAWYWVHKGTLAHLPSAAVAGDKLWVATRAAHDRSLQISRFDQATKQWRHEVLPDVSSDGAPGLVWFAGCLHLFFQQDRQVMKMESVDGRKWSRAESQGGEMRSSGGVCAVVHQGRLYVFCRDPNGEQVCVHQWGPGGWSKRDWLHIDTPHDIAAASLGDTLCVVTVDAGSGSPRGLMRAVLNHTGKWQPAQLERGATATGSPGITSRNGRFELFYREPGGAGMFHRSSADGLNWSGQDFDARLATMDTVCPAAFGDDLLLFYAHVHESGEGYAKRALAHSHYPAGVQLDASDHYPYQVDLVWPQG